MCFTLKYNCIYADDTVIFVSDNNISDIQHKLTCDLDNISKWCADNELILNFSEGKTEAMLFGTHKNLSLQESTLDISCSMHKIQLKTKYKYLGVELDPSLNLGLHFESTYKKATGRLRLLSKIRGYVDNHTAKTNESTNL